MRLFFLVLLMTVTLLPFVGKMQEFSGEFYWVFGVTFLFGVLVLAVDALTPNKKLGTVFGVYLGIIAGLVAALALGVLIDLIAESWDLKEGLWPTYVGLVKFAIGIALCYLAVSIVLTTKDDFRLVIPYVEFAKQVRGVRPCLVDTSAIIDGRIDVLGKTGFLDAPLVIPQFVINELQLLADMGDRIKRMRGRRGLGIVADMQNNPYLDVTIDTSLNGRGAVDSLLVRAASDHNMRILTTDFNLAKVAAIHNVAVLNMNDLANSIKSQLTPGDMLNIEVVKPGEGDRQGVGYLEDGTMVVIDDGLAHIGYTVAIVVTNSLQTAAGRMIFGRIADDVNPPTRPAAERMSDAATNQPRSTDRPSHTTHSSTSRPNPRR